MTDSILPSGEILELIKGQARLETKLDQFFSAQMTMKAEIDGLKADIGSVKTDVAEIRSQRSVAIAYFSAITMSGSGKGFKMRFRSCLMIACVASSLAGCATTADWCASNRPIRPTAEDVETMSSGTARQILEHNRMGVKACGWKP